MERFRDKVAVVTGAAQGIGFAAARRLGLEGARIVVVDRAAQPAQAAVDALGREGVDAVRFDADLAAFDDAHAAMRFAADTFGRVDVLVNNVGGTVRKKPFWHYTE